jgi:acetyltransferase-like isoleucine patch superfamily enzyme
MFGIKDAIATVRAKIRWRKLNPNNLTNAGFHSFGFDNVIVGDWTYGDINILTSSHEPRLEIGAFCSIARDVTFVICDEHPLDTFSTYPWKVRVLGEARPEALGKGGISVGDDVWLGYRSTVLDGVTIGRGGCVAAGAVVTKDVEPYTIVGGVPAKPIRKRFDEATIQRLMQVDFSKINRSYVEEHRDALYAPLDADVLQELLDEAEDGHEL